MEQKFNNLFVMNLPTGTTEEQLTELFAEFGEIESTYVQKNEDATLKNSGFVCFKDCENAKNAMAQMHKKVLPSGNTLIVNRHVSKKENQLEKNHIGVISQIKRETFNSNVYVKFIPANVTEEELQKVFTGAGQIHSVSLKQMKQGDVVTGQYAYILFDKVEEAQQAIRKYDNTNVFGSKPIRVELWLSREEIDQQKRQKETRQINQFLGLFHQ